MTDGGAAELRAGEVPPGYRPLDAEGAAAFAAPLLEAEPVEVAEIADGNLNAVYRISSATDSVVVKQALPYLRLVGDTWPLTLDRARIEAEALAIQERLAPGRVPRTLAFDKQLFAIALEDLAPAEVWRTALCAGREIAGVPAQVGEFAARTLLGSSSLLMDEAERKELRVRFVNPELCAITEDLVLSAPFEDSPSNSYDEAIADLAVSIREDEALEVEAARLRYEFRSRGEALLHGDLHTGSVMAVDGDARAIDPEFAFFGPIGFDTGNVIANLGLSRAGHAALGNSGFVAALDRMAAEFWDSFAETARLLWPREQAWFGRWLDGVLVDSGRYAGCETIRRVVGLAHAADIYGLDPEPRLRAQQTAVAAMRELLLAEPPRTFEELWSRVAGEA